MMQEMLFIDSGLTEMDVLEYGFRVFWAVHVQ